MKHVVFIVVVMALGIAAGVMVMHGRPTSAPVVEVDAPRVVVAIDAPVPIDAAAPDPVPEAAPDAAPAQAIDECDEVSCVLDNYERACCKKFDYRPKRPDASQKPDSLDRHMIFTGVQGAKEAIAACGDRSTTKGTAKAHVVVAPNGRPSSVRVETADNALAACITDALKMATFEPTEHGGSFTYPFVF